LRTYLRRGRVAATFEYHSDWLASPDRFSIEPALALTMGTFDRQALGAIGDSAPDTWGRQLMQRAERRRAAADGRRVRTLSEVDYLLGVSDPSRLGALRFKRPTDTEFQAPQTHGVPGLVSLNRLLQASRRILANEESDDDLQLIFAPGSSLGGARPKASVVDAHGQLSIAKFPKQSDDYRLELWEAVALTLAGRAGIRTTPHDLLEVDGASVLLSRRFDRDRGIRVPYVSALSMLGLADGERASYPEIVDALTRHGARAAADARELFRRMVLNVLISNVDDHLRNHGFLWAGRAGWTLSPVFDLNPTPVDVRARILTTSISLDEATCDLALVESVIELFGMSLEDGRQEIRRVGAAVATWRSVAADWGARPAEITRMASAFEHADLTNATA
jgi:serine/threonine-protein kinase HipA